MPFSRRMIATALLLVLAGAGAACLARAREAWSDLPSWTIELGRDEAGKSVVFNKADTRALLARLRTGQESAAAAIPVFHAFSFSDATIASGITFVDRLVPLLPHRFQYGIGNGVAIADVDGDGLPDIYFVSQVGGNELWRNKGSGRFEDMTARSGAGMPSTLNVSAAFGDIDNDGDEDLVATTIGGVKLFINNGKGVFADATSRWGLDAVRCHAAGATLFDYNNDGRLDLFVACMGDFTTDLRSPSGYFFASKDAPRIYDFPERAESPHLFKNNGDGTFTDVSGLSGLTMVPWTIDAAPADLRGDGYPDLYVLSMYGKDAFFENRRGTFVDATAQHFPATPFGSTGAKFFDSDNNGQADLFVADMMSDMSYEQKPEEEGRKSDRTYPSAARGALHGNAFFRAAEDGRYREVSDSLGLETYWPWGVSTGDLNADGRLDVFLASGAGSTYRYAANHLFLNDSRAFYPAEFLTGIEPRAGGAYQSRQSFDEDYGQVETLSSRGSAIFDADADGDLDLLIGEPDAPPRLLLSDLSTRTNLHYIKVRLAGTVSNRDGLGARVVVRAHGKDFVQFNDGKSGFLAQSTLPLYFGLADAASVESITVFWPSGKRQVVSRDIGMDRTITITEK